MHAAARNDRNTQIGRADIVVIAVLWREDAPRRRIARVVSAVIVVVAGNSGMDASTRHRIAGVRGAGVVIIASYGGIVAVPGSRTSC